MGVLPDCRVEHQHAIVRRRRLQLAHDADDLLQLGHQVGLVVQAARGVDQQHVGAGLACLCQGVVGHGGRIGALRPADDIAPGTLAPDLQLLDGRGPKRIGGRQDGLAALVCELFRQLGDRRRLARAVDADDEHDVGAVAWLDHQGPRHRLQRLGDVRRQGRAHVRCRDRLVEARLGQVGGQPRRRRDPQIGLDQQRLQRLQRRVVQPLAGEDAADALAQAAGRLLQTGAQAREPAAARLAHAGVRWSVRP